MKRMKRILALVFALIMVLSACNKDTPAESTAPSTTPAGETSTPSELPAEGKAVEDGDYTVEVPGNHTVEKVKVQVSFKDGILTNVEVLSHGETVPILQTVTELMIPRMLEHQSMGVDTITGATVSSNAIKSAVAAAITEAGGDVNEWNTRLEKSTESVKLEGYDVIVVGLGGAGMTAYMAAAQNGATVFGIEAAGKIGGNSAVAGGPMAVNPQTKMDSQNNGEKFFDEEELIEDWINYTRGDAKEEIIRLFVEESGETLDWMANDFEFKFMDVKPFFHPKQWAVVANYATEEFEDDDALDLNKTPMFTRAVDMAKAMNEKNDYMLELTATELILDGGEVVGVKAVYYDGTSYDVYGDSVILATGGFIGNSEMKLKYFGSDYRVEGVMQDDGAGIQMALDAGAGTYNIDMPAMVHVGQVKNIIRTDDLTLDQKAALTTLAQKSDSLIVGQSGKRFTDESSMFGIAFDNWKDGGYFYAIYSQDLLDDIKENGVEQTVMQMFLGQGATEVGVPIAELDMILAVGEQFGNVVRADTLEELAEKLGTPELVNTVEEYNSYADGTADPLGKDAALIKAIGEGPYVAICGAGYYYGTCGGLDIDENMQVLKEDGTPFSNLYSVGQDSMGVLFTPQDAYVTYGGAAQGWTITSGRLAGIAAAEKFAG